MAKDYVAIAMEYANGVLSGDIPACKWVQLACHRQLNDLKREGQDDFPYWFEPALANRVCQFIELLPHVKGEWARERKRLELAPWQIFRITTVFGWINEEGYRRFKTAYNEMPRKQGKSSETSGVGLYLLTADGEPGAEVYSAATTRDQAQITWKDAKQMVDRTPGLQARFGVATSSHTVFVEQTNSVFRPLSRDQGGNHDGLNVHGGLIDELHAHKTREIFDVIETGTGARKQPLLWLITTAGFNRAGICYEQRAYVTKILEGVVKDESYFGIIYTIDEDDDWTEPASWAKANPNWNISVNPEDIERKARKAMTMAAATNNFLTKHLNVWVNADTAWMDLQAWDKCGDPARTLDQFEGRKCWVGLDLASKIDVACLMLLFEEDDGWSVFGRYYIPEDAADEGRNQHYAGWARQGLVTLTPGCVTDYAYIESDLREFASRFDIQDVAFDPWQAIYLATRMQEEGLPMIEYRQTVANMSEPMKTLEALTLEGKIRHNGDPVLTWMMSNVVAHLDAKDNIYPRKEFPENKIDGVVALIMALGRAIRQQEPESQFVDTSFVGLL
ncbi:terminase [Marinobacter sp. EN3]|jgi:phage terminase large subunit-like protein|uniref:terminase large subunit n=1 Tax=Marinobacter sp. EN3 TaxID=1397533 RepID=UPI0003B81B39|nr:terminase TerL endonuclease subunit [Marinobacter sp. EN3]ERS12016.1 terminase [Marinobacter sp. EN3]